MRPFSGEAAWKNNTSEEPSAKGNDLDLDDPFGVPDHRIDLAPVASPLSFGVQHPEVPTGLPTPLTVPAPVHSGIRAHEERIVEPTEPSPTLKALVRKARGYAAVEFEEVPIDENSRAIFDMTHQAINKTLEPKEFSKLPTQGIPRGLIHMLDLFHRRGAYLMRLLPKDDPRYNEYGNERDRMERKILDVAARPEFTAGPDGRNLNTAVLELAQLVNDPFTCHTLLKLCEMRDPPKPANQSPEDYATAKIEEMVSLLT